MSLKILSKKYTPWDYLFTGVPKSFLIGNVCEAMRCEVEFSYAVEKMYTISNKLLLDVTSSAGGSSQIILTNADASGWNASGFAVGDSIVVNYTNNAGSVTPISYTATVDNIINDEMYITAAIGSAVGSLIMPTSADVNGHYIDNVFIYSNSTPEQISLKYFHAANSNNSAQGSNIDGTAPEIVYNNLSTTINGTTAGAFQNDQSGAALLGSPLVSTTPQITYKGLTNYTRNYTASFSLFIPPFGSQSEFQNRH